MKAATLAALPRSLHSFYTMSSSQSSHPWATGALLEVTTWKQVPCPHPTLLPFLPWSHNLPSDKEVPVRGLNSDLLKHTEDRKRGCRVLLTFRTDTLSVGLWEPWAGSERCSVLWFQIRLVILPEVSDNSFLSQLHTVCFKTFLLVWSAL